MGPGAGSNFSASSAHDSGRARGSSSMTGRAPPAGAAPCRSVFCCSGVSGASWNNCKNKTWRGKGTLKGSSYLSTPLFLMFFSISEQIFPSRVFLTLRCRYGFRGAFFFLSGADGTFVAISSAAGALGVAFGFSIFFAFLSFLSFFIVYFFAFFLFSPPPLRRR